jgi:hypothetical protein
MGRHSVLKLVGLAALAAALACEPPPPLPEGVDPHASLACSQCHSGGLADRSQAAVPTASCSTAGCHDRNVPSTVTLNSVRFTHLDHGATGSVAVGCAGCHTHAAGGEPLVAGAGTCGLCHEDALSGARGEDCRLCHVRLEHAAMTSQGVGIPHEGLPWIEGGCLRCHFAVAVPVRSVPLDRCAACHTDMARTTQAGIGRDLHPAHVGISCAGCHDEDTHRIQAMSSSVELHCTACHTQAHGAALQPGSLGAGTCNGCHGAIHEGPQRLLLGIPPEAEAASPSRHFMAGVGCASCHIPPAGDESTAALSGMARACVQCHRTEYATVLAWWDQGIRDRTRLVDRYLTGAEAGLGGQAPDHPARQAASRARTLLDLVATSGGPHNLPLTHRIFEDAVAGASESYRLSGRGVPPAPDLGRAPRQGVCAFCHYRLSEPGFATTMNDAFHREVLGGR